MGWDQAGTERKRCRQRAGELALTFEARGYSLTYRGWPDFIAVKGDEAVFVFKKMRGDHTAPQMRLMDALKKKHISVHSH